MPSIRAAVVAPGSLCGLASAVAPVAAIDIGSAEPVQQQLLVSGETIGGDALVWSDSGDLDTEHSILWLFMKPCDAQPDASHTERPFGPGVAVTSSASRTFISSCATIAALRRHPL